MSNEHEAVGLGPLPKADRNAELQRLSIRAFQSLLPPDRFVFRDERADDAGVDGSLELLIGSRYTNLRAQVQLKSTDSTATNADGSVSVQVRASNLNYLMNGPNPVYVLYVVPRDEVRYVWARDEWNRLQESNPEWTKQESITLRFQDILTVEAVEQIHRRIREEAQFQRGLTDLLGKASTAEQLVVSIDPETLKITDPERAKGILLKSGTAIVSAGYISQVKNLIRLLNLADAQLPRILLVQAHAEYMQGRYHIAHAILSDVLLRAEELSEDDKQFLKALRDGCDYQAGRITIEEFRSRLHETAKHETGGFAVSYRIGRLRLATIGTPDPARGPDLIGELRSLVEEVVKSTDFSDSFKMYARVSLLEAEGYWLTRKSLIELGEAAIALRMGRRSNLTAMLDAQREQISWWEQEMEQALREAVELGHPLLLADAILVRSSVAFQVHNNTQSIGVMFGRRQEVPQDQIQMLIENIGKAVEIFSKAGQLEGELRAKMLIADLYELAGREAEAKEIAGEVLPKAQAMGYAVIVGHAEELLSGQGLQSKIRETFREKTEEEQAVGRAAKSDEQLRKDAAQMLRINDLPTDRLPAIENRYFSVRAIAREQLEWCRHIELLEDERHTLHPATHYRTDPDYITVCRLLRYRSAVPSQDWATVISAFKSAYCEGCPERSPYNRRDAPDGLETPTK
jgi:tetratricopeptide (TPR) repeat protein